METVAKKTITSLTSDSVSILTQTFATDEYGTSEQVGSNHRTSYENSENGRETLVENEPEEIVATVLQMWGETPTIETPELPEIDDSEVPSTGANYTTDDIINAMLGLEG